MSEPKKVLVVDDEKLVCESCSSILSEEGFKVEATMSARDGLRRLDQERFDLVLADIRMPDIDGIELIESVKAKLPDMPIAVITGYPSVETAVKTTELGALEYLPKPFTPDELMAAVRSAMQKHEQALAASPKSDRSRTIDAQTVEAAIESEETMRDGPRAETRPGMITVDLNRCMACLSCVVECGLAHLSDSSPNRTAVAAMMRNARVQVESVGSHSVPMHCKQCEDAPCARACPSGALTRQGHHQPVVIDHERCIGCKNCLLACPFGCIYVSGESNMVIKCDHCRGIVEPGEKPVCVRSCPMYALKYVPVEEAGDELRGKAARELLDATSKTTTPTA